MKRLWDAVPLKVGIVLAPLFFLAGTVLRGEVVGLS